MSKGFKRRVGLAQAILHDPPVLVLDEPTDGLDPNQKHEVRSLIADMAKEKAIIISTHILEEVDAVCNRAMIIADGRILADGTPAELERQSPFHNAVLIDSQDDGVAEALEAMANVSQVEEIQGGRFRAYPKDGQSIVAEVAELVKKRSWSTSLLAVEQPRLDEVFRNITRARPQNDRASEPESGRGEAA